MDGNKKVSYYFKYFIKSVVLFLLSWKKITIRFEYEGKTFDGYFSIASGMGSSGILQLYDCDNFYYGQLFYSENFGW